MTERNKAGRWFAVWGVPDGNLIGEFATLTEALAVIRRPGEDAVLVLATADDQQIVLMGPDEVRAMQPRFVITGNVVTGSTGGGIQVYPEDR